MMEQSRLINNVADPERIASVALGAAVITLGIRRRDAAGLAAALLGAALVRRGATGHCPVYQSLGVSTGSSDHLLGASEGPQIMRRSDVTGRSATVNARKATKVKRSVTIGVSRDALYAFWRDFSNLPRFMDHLEAVTVKSPTQSHWKTKAPAGKSVEWDAEIINDIPNSLIAWKSIGNPDTPNAGSVHFVDSPDNRGTVVRVEIDVELPGGPLGHLVARLFGEDPDRQVRDDLVKFKQLMETGENATV